MPREDTIWEFESGNPTTTDDEEPQIIGQKDDTVLENFYRGRHQFVFIECESCHSEFSITKEPDEDFVACTGCGEEIRIRSGGIRGSRHFGLEQISRGVSLGRPITETEAAITSTVSSNPDGSHWAWTTLQDTQREQEAMIRQAEEQLSRVLERENRTLAKYR